MKAPMSIAVLLLALASARGEEVTVLHGEKTQTVEGVVEGGELLVAPEDVSKVNGFSVKKEGLCAGSLCVPLRDEWLSSGKFNVSLFAAHMKQPVASEGSVFSFGPVPTFASELASGKAPEFELPDRTGKLVRLSDFRGKKVMLLAWASW